MELFLIIYIIIQILSNFLIEILYRTIIKLKDIDSYKSIGELERDINVKYTPAIVSMLYDNKIEPCKDIVATILNLNLKGYILFDKDKNNRKYKIKQNLQANSIDNMCIEEKYIYDWLIKNKNFNFVEWVNVIKKEYSKVNFTKPCEVKTRNMMLIILILIFGIFYVIESAVLVKFYSENIASLLLGLVLVPIVMIITIVTVNNLLKNVFLNNLGNKEVQRWTKFKRFMHNYTLIEDKNVESIAIYEKYLPYSMALNVNKKYKTIWKDVIPKKDRFKIKLHYTILENIFIKPIMQLVKGEDSVSKYYS